MSPAEPEAHPTPGLGWHLVTCIDALKGCQKPLNYRHQDPHDTQTHGSPCACGTVSPGAWASVSATDLSMLPTASSVLLISLAIYIYIYIDLASPWCPETSQPKLGQLTLSVAPKRTARSPEIC